MSDTAKRHLAAIRAGEVTKTNVIGIRKAFNAFERDRAGYSNSRTAPQLSADDYSAIESALASCHPRVTGELDASGRKLLQGRRYAKRLAIVAHIIAALDHFRLVGFDWLDATHCVPIYRAMTRDGRGFNFRNVAWQSGGDGPEILA